ncbi:general stress protein [Miniimonas arenae]|uniref:General stress protein n=1 Tax=Miniimonas arenae TaxID=676201 RepID=A0A5C5BAY9_9MICO|nr:MULTISPECIES: pyridoxamine 5'-phosphate oxidase family protein [Miniimonas]TNU74133.1 general stress protein [Miniimonas arenae]
MTASQEDLETIAGLVKKARTAFVTTVGPEGELLSRPLAVVERDFDGTLYFLVAEPSPKTAQLEAHPHVNVAITAGDSYLSIAGTASVSRDQAKIDELWNPHAEAWFEGGREDPAVALLKVDADSAEYWTMDDPKPVALVKYAVAMVKGEEPDVATNRSVDL